MGQEARRWGCTLIRTGQDHMKIWREGAARCSGAEYRRLFNGTPEPAHTVAKSPECNELKTPSTEYSLGGLRFPSHLKASQYTARETTS